MKSFLHCKCDIHLDLFCIQNVKCYFFSSIGNLIKSLHVHFIIHFIYLVRWTTEIKTSDLFTYHLFFSKYYIVDFPFPPNVTHFIGELFREALSYIVKHLGTITPTYVTHVIGELFWAVFNIKCFGTIFKKISLILSVHKLFWAKYSLSIWNFINYQWSESADECSPNSLLHFVSHFRPTFPFQIMIPSF